MNFRGTRHENIFPQELTKRKNPTSSILYALYLLTVDDRLWARVKHHVEGDGPMIGFIVEAIVGGIVGVMFMVLFISGSERHGE